MPSLFDGTDDVIREALRIADRQGLKRNLKLKALSDAEATHLVRTLFNRVAENSPTRPRSASNQLWRNTQETNISDHNQSPEKMLEKSVASLASRDHMPGWFN